jgi:hypothetical protein
VPTAENTLDTPERVAKVEASDGGVSEVESIAIANITDVEPSFDPRGGSLVLRGADAELAVHRAHIPQVHAMVEALA